MNDIVQFSIFFFKLFVVQITCVKEEETPSFAFREFNLTHVEMKEERHIRHMQYIAWPDHGVPDDPSDFLHFVTLAYCQVPFHGSLEMI